MIRSSNSSILFLETFPDEILVLICRYLSSIDILYSFYGLNTRLNRTISETYCHLFLGEVSYQRLKHISSSIIPQIGYNIRTLTISNQLTENVSKLFLVHFGQQISVIFSRLKCLTLTELTTDVLSSIIDNLTNLTDLTQLNIYSLNRRNINVDGIQILLDKMFSANNSRLDAISYDRDSIPLTIIDQNNPSIYSNIKKLEIFLERLNDLHHLLTRLPQIQIIHGILQYESSEFNYTKQYSSVESLIELKLLSLGYSFNFHELLSVLNRTTNIETLAIKIDNTDDFHLINGIHFKSYLSSLRLKQFHYLVNYTSDSPINRKEILSTWKQFPQQFDCLISDDQNKLILYTIPINFSHLAIMSAFLKNLLSVQNNFDRIQSLTLYGAPNLISEVFPILLKCRKVKYLVFEGDGELILKSEKENRLCELNHLTHLSLIRSSIESKSSQELFQSSPNLFDLNVHFKSLHSLLEQQSIIHLLEARITHLYIFIIYSDDFEQVRTTVSRLSAVFKRLKHLYINKRMNDGSFQSLIVPIFNQLTQWSSLISLEIFGLSDKLQDDIRQWLRNNSPFNEPDSFISDYPKRTCKLWL
ncbi:unnamed protein product [Didymodactylos carnosus]|uniref:F-box domain-containing protein n=1 Tax=Didymodactylos carnosus TaxID=1234261 RepID=A0A815ZCS9_9BILA|nr:unnamed protein product [Didymodactylos carnosus]CAF4451022.1 unnamed protein product [Didymodactylos carnosus]